MVYKCLSFVFQCLYVTFLYSVQNDSFPLEVPFQKAFLFWMHPKPKVSFLWLQHHIKYYIQGDMHTFFLYFPPTQGANQGTRYIYLSFPFTGLRNKMLLLAITQL